MSEPPQWQPPGEWPPPTPPPASSRRGARPWVVAASVVVVLLVAVGVAFFAFVTRDAQAPHVDAITADEAGCGDVVTRPAVGHNDHVHFGRDIDYPVAPPAFGPHWQGYVKETDVRSFYTVDGRPPVEEIVHNLEHGYTVMWYDEQADADAVRALVDGYASEVRIIAVPWTSDDGAAFPAGHVALTHWRGTQQGVWSFCDQPDAGLTDRFVRDYPAADAPEPGVG